MYRDLINQDHQEDRDRGGYYRSDSRRSRDRDRDRGDQRDRRDRDSRYKKGGDYSPNSYLEEISNDSHER